MPAKRKSAKKKNSTANLGFEAKLWLTATKIATDYANIPHIEQTARALSQPTGGGR